MKKLKDFLGVLTVYGLLSLTAFAQQSVNQAPVVPAALPPQIEILQTGVTLTLLAEHPDLMTPTGIDVDEEGRIWLVACHTHFRPEGYVGPEHDEILVFDKDGKNRHVFYNKTDATMQIKLGKNGWVYLAQRDRILRVKDVDGDGAGEIEETIATLDTVADYPHNGLSGMAWHPDGGLVFSLGENFGKDWTLTARDGSQVSGRGEGGIFRCTSVGAKLNRIARGFWNPFGLLVRDDGEMFAAENDPGSRPPCRLLNIVEGADYGFQWVYGSSPVHPFVAWNGELRGTIGMVHPSGEGPCSVVELGGGVMIPSWSNHCIDYFPLIRHGAGYTSQRIELLRGSDFFRPVCMARGPDGSFYLTDWVFSSYQLHGRGRLWKIEIDPSKAPWINPVREPMNASSRLAKDLRDSNSELKLFQLLELAQGSDAYLSDAALTAMARQSSSWTPESLLAMSAKDRVWALVALRRVDLKEEKWVRALLKDFDTEVRFECLRWIADAVLTNFRPDVEEMLTQQDLEYRLFEATLATWNTLRGKPEAGVTDPEVLVDRVTNTTTPPRLRGYALRLVPAVHPKITVPLLRELFAAGDPVLMREVVRTLAARSSKEAWTVLSEIAVDESYNGELRADAIVGLANSLETVHCELLVELASHNLSTIRNEALRALRLRELDGKTKQTLSAVATKHPLSASLVSAILDHDKIHQNRPALGETEEWLQRLASMPGKPDAESGRRIFFHTKLASCANCHRYQGRGNVVGPDLSLIARQGDRASLLRSILEPNREVAPQYFSTLLELEDGTIFSGILLRSSSTEVFRDATGKERTFQKSDILQRKELKTSLMPTGLAEQLTYEEIRDLLEFLSET